MEDLATNQVPSLVCWRRSTSRPPGCWDASPVIKPAVVLYEDQTLRIVALAKPLPGKSFFQSVRYNRGFDVTEECEPLATHFEVIGGVTHPSFRCLSFTLNVEGQITQHVPAAFALVEGVPTVFDCFRSVWQFPPAAELIARCVKSIGINYKCFTHDQLNAPSVRDTLSLIASAGSVGKIRKLHFAAVVEAFEDHSTVSMETLIRAFDDRNGLSLACRMILLGLIEIDEFCSRLEDIQVRPLFCRTVLSGEPFVVTG